VVSSGLVDLGVIGEVRWNLVKLCAEFGKMRWGIWRNMAGLAWLSVTPRLHKAILSIQFLYICGNLKLQ
jgi:hypothetical protein